MKRLLSTALFGLILAAGSAWGVDQKEDATYTEKLVGKWEGAHGQVGPDDLCEFLKDGGFKVLKHFGPGLKKSGEKVPPRDELIAEGKYKVENKVVVYTAKIDGKEMTLKHKIKTLDDKTFSAEDEEGQKVEYKRMGK
jgi:uncharacterized protein (TIGR03066 family)